MLMIKRNRLTFIILCIVLSLALGFGLATPTFAAECTGAETSILDCEAGGDGGIWYIIKLITDILTAGIGVLATVGFIIGGYTILTAKDDQAKVTKAKKRMLEIVIGLVAWGLFWLGLNLLLPNGSLHNDAAGITGISIEITETPEIGEYTKPEITIYPDTIQNQTYTLKSEDPLIAMITGGNSIKCIAYGPATITVISANGLKDTATVMCKEKTISTNGNPNNGGNDSGDDNDGTIYYEPYQIATVVSLFNTMPDQDYNTLKQLAKTRYGLSEDNFIGVVAWARTENYENHNPGDASGIYMAYLCSSVAINIASDYEANGNGSGWLNEMLGYAPQSVYSSSRYWGTDGYYQSNLKIVRIALDHKFPNVKNCNGMSTPSNPVYTWTSVYGEKDYVW